MKNTLLLGLTLLFYYNAILAQCDITFSDSNPIISFSDDIVNAHTSGSNLSFTQSFDIWDNSNATLDCTSSGGGNDITFTFNIISTFDPYNNIVIDEFAGVTHDVIQDGTGLKGQIPLGTSTATETSVGDIRGYTIQVDFASHIVINAQDITVNMNSINSSGKAFESTSLLFHNELGSPYGTAIYNGFYGNSSSGASTDECFSPVFGNPWSISGTGVFIAASGGTVDQTDPCLTAAGSNGPFNNKNVSAVTDAGLSNNDRIGGFIITVYVEDVAATDNGTPSPFQTTTNTSLSSTLEGVSISSASLLPIELLLFSGKNLDKGIELTWETSQEINNNFFEIQKSHNGQTFQIISEINGKGTDQNINEYNFIDKNPTPGLNYYRLKQVDYDGSFSYSKVISVYFGEEREPTVYPTIATDKIQISIPNEIEVSGTAAIFDLNGRHVKSINLSSEPGIYEMPVSDLEQGLYFVKVRSGDQISTHRFIKQ